MTPTLAVALCARFEIVYFSLSLRFRPLLAPSSVNSARNGSIVGRASAFPRLRDNKYSIFARGRRRRNGGEGEEGGGGTARFMNATYVITAGLNCFSQR